MPVKYVLCLTDNDHITYHVFGPFDDEEKADFWADEMEYDSYKIFELTEPEDV